MFGKLASDIEKCNNAIDQLASMCMANFEKLSTAKMDDIETRIKNLETITSNMKLFEKGDDNKSDEGDDKSDDEKEDDNKKNEYVNNYNNINISETNILLDELSHLRIGEAVLYTVDPEKNENESESEINEGEIKERSVRMMTRGVSKEEATTRAKEEAATNKKTYKFKIGNADFCVVNGRMQIGDANCYTRSSDLTSNPNSEVKTDVCFDASNLIIAGVKDGSTINVATAIGDTKKLEERFEKTSLVDVMDVINEKIESTNSMFKIVKVYITGYENGITFDEPLEIGYIQTLLYNIVSIKAICNTLNDVSYENDGLYVVTEDVLETGIRLKFKESYIYNCNMVNNLVIFTLKDKNTMPAYQPIPRIYNKNISYSRCFEGSTLDSLDLSSWDISNVIDLSYCFSKCESLTTLNISTWDISKIINMSYFLNECKLLSKLNVVKKEDEEETKENETEEEEDLNVSKWDVSNVTDMSYCFNDCESLTALDVSSWNTSKMEGLVCCFANCNKLTSLDVSGWDVSNVTDLSSCFGGCTGLTSLDVSKWNVSKVTNLGVCFGGCTGLTSLDVSKWNVSNVTNMMGCFGMCTELTSLDVSGWDVSKVEYMMICFTSCEKLTSLNIKNWKPKSLTEMTMTFTGTGLTSLDLSGWELPNLETLFSAFSQNESLTSLNLSGWSTPKLDNLSYCFWSCPLLSSLDVSGWNVNDPTNTRLCFGECPLLTYLDLSSWYISSDNLASDVFSGCTGLTTIKCTSKMFDIFQTEAVLPDDTWTWSDGVATKTTE